MEAEYLWNFKRLQWHEILRFILVVILTAGFAYKAWKWRKIVCLVNKIPSSRLKFYHVLGHSHYVIYERLLRKPLSPHVYDFIAMNGYCHVFMAEGLCNLWAINHPSIIIFKADAVETVLSHSTQLEKSWNYRFTHPWLGDGLLTSHGTKWKTRRKLLTPAFHFNILKDFLPVFNTRAKIFADILSKHTETEFIDIVPFVTRCSLDVICESLLGVEMHVQTNPTSPYVKSVIFLTGAIGERLFNPLIWPDLIFKISPLGRKFKKHVKLVHDFTYELIKEKKSNIIHSGVASVCKNNDDCFERKKRALLDLLLDEHINNNTLSEEDIIEEVDTFTFEGHDTTAMAMSWALYLIGLHPGVQGKVHQEMDKIFGDDNRDATMDDLKDMKYLESVLKESLRLYPSVPVYARRLNEDMEIQGRVVPKGSSCYVFAYLLHRNPEFFPNPEKFDPDRFSPENSAGRHPFAYVPFSAGPRNCIGQRFALMEEKAVISTLLRKFKIRSLDPRDKVHVMDEIVLRPVDGLRMEIRPRNYIPEKTVNYYNS